LSSEVHPGAPMIPEPHQNRDGRYAARLVGRRAKCSYLMWVATGSSYSAPERAASVAALLDDVDALTADLDVASLAALRSMIDRALARAENSSPWTMVAVPDDEVSDDHEIDGLNVRRVAIPGGSDSVAVAHVSVPGGQQLVVSVEYSLDTEGSGIIEIVDAATDSVLAAERLTAGHHVAADLIVELTDRSETTLVVRLQGEDAAAELWWYSASFTTLPGPADGTALSEILCDEAAADRRKAQSELFVPPTREPLLPCDIDRLTSLHNRFKGERIFIMGNGPSLNRTPLDLLENDYVFGLNRVSLLFDRVSWRPTFFTAFDVRVVPDNQEEFAALDVPYKFFSARYKEMLGERPQHYWYHTKGFYEGFEHCFEPNAPYTGFGGGGTIAVIATEIAFYLGFREIYLIGTDVSYSVPATVKQDGQDVFGDGVKLELQSTADDDPNHFDPRYFGKDKKWHNPNVREMKIGFGRAAAYVERRGGVLMNATVGGELDTVPRAEFESLF